MKVDTREICEEMYYISAYFMGVNPRDAKWIRAQEFDCSCVVNDTKEIKTYRRGNCIHNQCVHLYFCWII